MTAARMPQLDALRAIAVGTVMLHHYYGATFIGRYVPIGEIGVRLFFVISGFLITGILLSVRGQPGGLPTFYIRRALRLLPLYYVVVAILVATEPYVREHWPYYAFHAVNILMATEERFVPGTHFWTLGVEEQFYLLWPAVALLLNRRWLAVLCVALIVFAPIFRFGGILLTGDYFAGDLLPSTADSLAAGALLAVLRDRSAALRSRAFVTIALVSLAAALAINALAKGGVLYHTLIETVQLPFLAWVVIMAASGFTGLIGWILSNPALRYLGVISYGLYVIHLFVPRLVDPFLPRGLDPYVLVVLYSAITVAIAAASWHLFEGPINRLKDRFRYAPARSVVAA